MQLVSNLKTFKDLSFSQHPMHGAYDLMPIPHIHVQARLFFKNGYGASVIRHSLIDAAYEVAVLKGDEDNASLCYDTRITEDVIKCDNQIQVTNILINIQNL